MFANKDDFLSIEREKQTTLLVTSAFRSSHVTILLGLVQVMAVAFVEQHGGFLRTC